jgi:hypothetical protein
MFNILHSRKISLLVPLLRRRWAGVVGLIFIFVFLFCPLAAYSAELTLSWQPSTDSDVAGYRLFCRQDGESYDYSHPVWEGPGVTCTYEFDAVVNTTYCFVVRAFDTAGNESTDSNEACWTAPAFVLESLSITGPASVNEGDTASYVATATFSNGDTGEATNTAVWHVEPGTYASISSGQLTTWAVPSHQVVTITASYTFGLVTKEAQKQVTIVEVGTDDTDGDGLPDWWESAHGLDPTNAVGINGHDGDFDDDGCTNYEEYVNSTDPADDTSPAPTPPEVKQVNPHNKAGIDDSTRVPDDFSFAIRMHDSDGIDITDGSSIRFTINDGINSAYERNLANTEVVRVIKLDSGDPDSQVSKLWAVYDRSLEPVWGNYAYGTVVNIKVEAKDRRDDWMSQKNYDFSVETEKKHKKAKDNSPRITSTDLSTVDPEGIYDAGIEVTDGDLEGAIIVYDSGEPVQPTFGPTDELPPLDQPGTDAVGMPMNLQPPTVFSTPVKLLIPCPSQPEVSNLDLYFYDGKNWEPACDENGIVHPAAESWMLPGSRIDHPETNPPTIEIKVYHFTGVQAGIANRSDVGDTGETGGPSAVERGGSDGACFIRAADCKSGEAPALILLSSTIGISLAFGTRLLKRLYP